MCLTPEFNEPDPGGFVKGSNFLRNEELRAEWDILSTGS
jgi:hypothetical protein